MNGYGKNPGLQQWAGVHCASSYSRELPTGREQSKQTSFRSRDAPPASRLCGVAKTRLGRRLFLTVSRLDTQDLSQESEITSTVWHFQPGEARVASIQGLN